jgi:hypothetical protein
LCVDDLNSKVQLVFIDAPRNLLGPFISRNLDDILVWNNKVDEYIVRGTGHSLVDMYAKCGSLIMHEVVI